MKKFIYVVFAGVLLTAGCIKEKFCCRHYTALNDRNHLVDLSPLQQAPELKDSLSKYPQLQVFRIINDDYTVGMHCHVFYRELLVFSDTYRVFKSKNDGSVYTMEDTIPQNLNIASLPTIPFDRAIEIAKQNVDFEKSCISYRLGIWDVNAGISYQPKNYQLAWKVQDDDNIRFVVLDATTGEVYSKDDGIRY